MHAHLFGTQYIRNSLGRFVVVDRVAKTMHTEVDLDAHGHVSLWAASPFGHRKDPPDAYMKSLLDAFHGVLTSVSGFGTVKMFVSSKVE